MGGDEGSRRFAGRITCAGDLTRRDFLAVGVVSAATLGFGGAGALALEASTVYLRPPGARDENDLLAHCNRCQRCVQACPHSIVQPIALSAAFMATGTPELAFETGYCDFCMRCVDECPTGALREGTSTYDDIGVAKVVSDACVAWDWAGCTVCVDECPVEGAIVLDEHSRPLVQEALCNGCGKCEMACPASSLRAYNPAVLEKGIYVVPRASAAAAIAGACTSAVLSESRSRAADQEAGHA